MDDHKKAKERLLKDTREYAAKRRPLQNPQRTDNPTIIAKGDACTNKGPVVFGGMNPNNVVKAKLAPSPAPVSSNLPPN
ncbi:hypothetical protein V496_05839 [Pseudogymnoascus sp. VKM F-4515 (FW-2607)]|nr:hypothetical protein V496_05839 [Pseudogymnoascus sp. VKM F-4515 (FW-2607)]KFY96827.1 hypothetical protein V498_02420 [Pseudogymnoascus sp. VKM F-4517 (FW-2822)]